MNFIVKLVVLGVASCTAVFGVIAISFDQTHLKDPVRQQTIAGANIIKPEPESTVSPEYPPNYKYEPPNPPVLQGKAHFNMITRQTVLLDK